MTPTWDVLVIGAGVIGCSVARELSRYSLKVAVLEKGPDVCMETSSRNSGVLHAGYNNKPGSLMAKFCVEGNQGFDKIAEELDIPYKRTGKLIVGFTDDDRVRLEGLKAQGEANCILGMEIVDRAFIDEKAPEVQGNFALWSPTTAIISPFQVTFGMAENAAANGVEFFFDSEVTGIERDANAGSQDAGAYGVQGDSYEYTVHTASANVAVHKTRWVINCAGLGSDKISKMLGIDDYTIYPCRGEYYILDKQLSDLLPLPAYPVPNIKTGGLGIHLTPSIDGNILIGPSTEYIDERDNYAATRPIMDMLLREGAVIFPQLKQEHFIRNFAGTRPKLVPKNVGGYHDFVIERREDVAPHAVNLVGIESPGLTSSVPISREVVRKIEEVEKLTLKDDFNPIRRRIVTFRDKTPEQQAQLIKENPDYGEIFCRCETITKAEVLAAVRAVPGAQTMTGVKYRCRAMMGRCQGGYCQTRISELLMQEKNIPANELTYERRGSYIFTQEVRSHDNEA